MMSAAFGLDHIIDNNWVVLGLSLIICPVIYLLLCFLFKLNALNEMALIVVSNKYCPQWLNKLLSNLLLKKS